jgi:cysteine desulfurase / selenocysteine lyase
MKTAGRLAVPPPAARATPFEPRRARKDFPVLGQLVHGRPLVYLDNAATTHKPLAVLDAVTRFYNEHNSNVHRGVHELSQRATNAYEGARARVARFLNARHDSEIVFVRGTTEAVNLVAHSFAGPRVGPGDEVLLTAMEHHSNIVPWQMLCERNRAVLRVAPITDEGVLDMDRFAALLGPRTKLVSLVHMSNALGTINPVRDIVRLAHARGIPVLLDGAQAVAHRKVDVQDLDCDFYAFSGHKMYGPTGIGALYGKTELLEAMPPYQGGGDMITSVSFEKTTYNKAPHRFEAGTPHIAGAVGLAAAIDYVEGLGIEQVAAHEDALVARATAALSAIPRLRFIGTAPHKASVVSFVLEGIHPHDIGTVLDQHGIAIRAGHHCTQPLMDRFGVPATARASMALYNLPEEIDALAAGIVRVFEVFG